MLNKITSQRSHCLAEGNLFLQIADISDLTFFTWKMSSSKTNTKILRHQNRFDIRALWTKFNQRNMEMDSQTQT